MTTENQPELYDKVRPAQLNYEAWRQAKHALDRLNGNLPKKAASITLRDLLSAAVVAGLPHIGIDLTGELTSGPAAEVGK